MPGAAQPSREKVGRRAKRWHIVRPCTPEHLTELQRAERSVGVTARTAHVAVHRAWHHSLPIEIILRVALRSACPRGDRKRGWHQATPMFSTPPCTSGSQCRRSGRGGALGAEAHGQAHRGAQPRLRQDLGTAVVRRPGHEAVSPLPQAQKSCGATTSRG